MQSTVETMAEGATPVTEAPLRLAQSDLRRRIDDFVRDYLTDKSPATVGTYRRSLNEFERWVARQKGAVTVTSDRIEAYKRYLMQVRGLHQVSVSTYLTALRRLCQYLVDIGQLDANPAKEVKGNRRPDSHSRDVLTNEEVDALLASVSADTPIGKRDLAVISLMLFGGLSEIEIVRADVIDLEQTLLGWYLKVQGKGRTDKDQQVPLEQRVVDRIQDYLSMRGRVHNEEPLFVSHGHRSSGARLNTRSVRSRVSMHLKAAGVKRPGITPHSLTHTAALIWLDGGMDIEEVRKRLRHGTIDTTMIHFRKQGQLFTEVASKR